MVLLPSPSPLALIPEYFLHANLALMLLPMELDVSLKCHLLGETTPDHAPLFLTDLLSA